MVKLHIPEHNCDMHKMIIGISTQPRKGTTYYQCAMCNYRWDESEPIYKTTRFEGLQSFSSVSRN